MDLFSRVTISQFSRTDDFACFHEKKTKICEMAKFHLAKINPIKVFFYS